MVALQADERQLFVDTLGRLLREQYEFSKRRTYLASSDGWSRDVWAQYAGIGLLGLGIDEEHGGAGGSVSDIATAMQELGRALAVEPVLGTMIAGQALQLFGSQQQKTDLLPRLAAGELVFAVALGDAGGSGVTAELRDGAWTLSGTAACVIHAASAEQLLVAANTGTGAALFLAAAGANGVSISEYAVQDGSRASDVAFANVAGEPLGNVEETRSSCDSLHQIGAVAVCASSIGAMAAALDQTIAYTKTRRVFGKALVEFQAVRHRIADMYIAREKSMSITLAAVNALDADNGGGAGRAVSAAKVLVSKNAWFVTEQAIQLHGGIGMTEECAVGHFMRRHMVNDQLFGSPMQHLEILTRFEDLAGQGVSADMRERRRQ